MINTDAEDLAAVHLIAVVRGLTIAAVLFVFAPVIADFFGVPQFATSFALLAFGPLVGCFAHLGIAQVQRDFNYAPATIAIVSSASLGIITLVPFVYLFRDHRAAIASFWVEVVAGTLATHLLAQTPYRIWPHRATLKAALSFGFPIMLNGIGLAALSQLDRIIVGHWFGVSTLGLYSIILSAGTTPVSLIHRVFGTMSLSYLAKKNKSGSLRVDDYRPLVFLFALLGVLYSLFVALTLDIITPFVFGPAFSVTPAIHILVTLIAFFEIQKGGTNTAALLVTGQTKELALLNTFSGTFGIVSSLVVLFFWPNLESMLVGLLIGALIAFALSFFSTSARMSAWGPTVRTDLIVALGALAILVGMLVIDPGISWTSRGTIFGVGMVAIAIQLAIGLREHKAIRNLVSGHHLSQN